MTADHQGQTFQLSYGDCDTVGIAYFAIFYPWMERTWSTWLYSHGIRSGQMTEDFGVYTVGMQSACEYLAPCHVFDVLRTQLVREHVGTTSFSIGCEFWRGEELVARARLLFACRGLDHAKAPMPDALMTALASLPSLA